MEILVPPEATAYDVALDMAAALEIAGIVATLDPRAATPPCVLITPPRSDFTAQACGAYCTFELYALAPGPGNADAFRMLEYLTYWVRKVLPDIESSDLTAYNLSPDNPSIPAYRLVLNRST